MIRCTIELLPGGSESRARTIGLVEITNAGGTAKVGDYIVVLTKTPPFRGALKAAWRTGRIVVGLEDEEIIVGKVEGHHREKRGSYDLLFRALAATVGDRNPQADRDLLRSKLEYAVRVGHEGLLASLRAGKVWPTVIEALAEAGLQVVPIAATDATDADQETDHAPA
jgi:hypothetical protein